MIIGLPVLDTHSVTLECIGHLRDSIQNPKDIKLVIVDNASDPAYGADLGEDFPFPVEVKRNAKNVGFYYPILQLHELYPDEDIIAVMHNDVFIYEYGWDERLKWYFEQDEKLSVIGFCGSDEVDVLGGRGGGTMCNFRGTKGQLQENTGKRIVDLHPALVTDSLFMAFRNSIIPELGIDQNITPGHFYDKILPMRAIEKGGRVAILGVEIDHMGGTSLGARMDKDMREWCLDHGLEPGENAGLAVYLEAENRWLSEFRDQKNLIPSRVNEEYAVFGG